MSVFLNNNWTVQSALCCGGWTPCSYETFPSYFHIHKAKKATRSPCLYVKYFNNDSVEKYKWGCRENGTQKPLVFEFGVVFFSQQKVETPFPPHCYYTMCLEKEEAICLVSECATDVFFFFFFMWSLPRQSLCWLFYPPFQGPCSQLVSFNPKMELRKSLWIQDQSLFLFVS